MLNTVCCLATLAVARGSVAAFSPLAVAVVHNLSTPVKGDKITALNFKTDVGLFRAAQLLEDRVYERQQKVRSKLCVYRTCQYRYAVLIKY